MKKIADEKEEGEEKEMRIAEDRAPLVDDRFNQSQNALKPTPTNSTNRGSSFPKARHTTLSLIAGTPSIIDTCDGATRDRV